jgi:hypothetical protein
MPKGKGKGTKVNFGKGRIDDELEAYDYAEEESAYQHWEEKQVKENNFTSEKKVEDLWEKPFVPLAQRKEEKATAPKVEEKATAPKEEEPAVAPWEEEKEVVLEQYDNWEDAMDALDAHISKQEEIKSEAIQRSKNDSAAKGKK